MIRKNQAATEPPGGLRMAYNPPQFMVVELVDGTRQIINTCQIQEVVAVEARLPGDPNTLLRMASAPGVSVRLKDPPERFLVLMPNGRWP